MKLVPSHFTWSFSFLALCLTIALGGCSQEQLSVEDRIQRAKDLSAQGKVKEAQIELRNVLQEQPNNPQVNLLMAEMSMKIGNPQMAEVELKKAREYGVAPEAIRVELARSLLMQGRAEEALKEAQPGQRDSAQNREKLVDMQSRALLALGRVDESCKKSRSIFDAQPDSILAAQGMARCALVRDKDYKQAEAYLRAALAKDKNEATTWALIGGLVRMQQRTGEAIDAFNTSLSLDPLQIATRTQLANIFIAEDRLDEADIIIKDGMKLVPSPALVHLQALVNFKKKQYAEAKDNLVLLMKSSPNYMPAVLLNGLTAYALGNYEQAAKDLARYLSQFPGSGPARRALAATQLRQGQAKLVAGTLAPLVQGDKPDSIALGLLGEAYQALGEHSKALVVLQQSASLEPKMGAARTLLGISHAAVGDSGLALTELSAATQFDTEISRASNLLVSYHMGRKEYDKALLIIAKLVKSSPDDPAVHNQTGLAYLGKQDMVKARASFEKALGLKPGYLPAASGLARLDILEKKDYVSARKRFESVLAQNKTNAQTMLALAKLAAMEKKTSEYVDWLTKASATDSKAIEPRILLAEHHLAMKEFQKALAVAREAVSLQPDSSITLGLLARVQVVAGEKENAMMSYEKLAIAEPMSAAIHYQLGLLQADAKKWQAARATLSKAVELMPNYVRAAEALAMLELSQNKAAEALQIARRLQLATPKSTQGVLLEGDLLTQQKQYKAAAQAYGKAFDARSDSNALMKLHQAQAKAGDINGADKRVNAWLLANPKDSVVRGYYANDLGGRKAYKEAARQYEILLVDSPGNPFATNDLAWLYAKLNDPRALATAEQALKLFPGNAATLDTLGWLLVEQGQAAKGLKYLEQAAEKSGTPSIAYHLAVAQARTGDKAKARQTLEKLLKSNSRFEQEAEARTLLIQLH